PRATTFPYTTLFRSSEVRLGLIPAAISPYVIAAMGQRAARRYFLTGERFAAREALRYGLVHEVCSADALDARVEALVNGLLLCRSEEHTSELQSRVD